MRKVSITIPARNEEGYIEKCLQSIIESDYPKEYIKVFVCDGLSTDNTVEQVLKFTKRHPFIKLLKNKKKTTPYALNLGLKESIADYKIILGAHSTIEKDFIKKNIEIFEKKDDNKIACVGGVIENIYENNDSKIIGLAMSSPFGVGNAHFRTMQKSGYVDTVAFGMYKSEIFDEIGYFDEELTRNQDDEFNFRILKNGYKIYLSKDIKSKYYVRSSFRKLYKQYYQYGFWKVVVNKKHKSITTLRQAIPPLFVLFLFGGFIASFFNILILASYLTILITYLGIAVYESSKTNLKLKDKGKQVKTFFILHFSYGIGYLNAIFSLLFFRTFAVKNKTEITR